MKKAEVPSQGEIDAFVGSAVAILIGNAVADFSALEAYAARYPDHLEAQSGRDHGRNLKGCTALMAAAFTGNKIMVEKLLELGADINGQNPDKPGLAPLLAAANMGHVDVVRILLEHPDIDINLENALGRTARMTAAARMELSNPEMVERATSIVRSIDARVQRDLEAGLRVAEAEEQRMRVSTSPKLQRPVRLRTLNLGGPS